MTDDVKALIARVQAELESYDEESLSTDVSTFDQWRLLYDVKVALEAATVAPAVDREALVEWFKWHADPNDVADALLASGILRDVRDVQAEALEQAAGAMYGDAVVLGGVPGWLRARAQAIREARSER